MYEKVICRHGTPEILISDSANKFTANILTEVCKFLNVEQIHTSPYHPQSHGVVERFNGTLIRMLALYVSQNQTDWDSLLPGILFGYHTTYHQSTKNTPFQTLYGRRARLPNDISNWPTPNLNIISSQETQNIIKNIHLSQQIAKQNNEESQVKMKTRYDTNSDVIEFKVGDQVLLRDSMKKRKKSKIGT